MIALAWEICQMVAQGKRIQVDLELRGWSWDCEETEKKVGQSRVQRGESSEWGLQRYADGSIEGFTEYWSVCKCEKSNQGQGKSHPKGLEEYIPESKELWELLFTAAEWKSS